MFYYNRFFPESKYHIQIKLIKSIEKHIFLKKKFVKMLFPGYVLLHSNRKKASEYVLQRY